MADISEFFNKEKEIPEPAQLPPLESMLPGPAVIPADAGKDLAALLQLMQEGVVTKPMWFMDPESMRSVVMIPLDITALTPGMNKQLAEIMELNVARAPR